MKKIYFAPVILLIVFAVHLSGCGATTKQMKGRYDLAAVIVKDYRMSPSHYNAEYSYIDVSGIDDNSFSSLDITLLDDSSYLSGYISKDTEYSDTIRYKYHIVGNIGSLISDSVDMIYLYYSPSDDTISIDASGDIQLVFSK